MSVETGVERDDKGTLYWLDYRGRQYSVYVEGTEQPPAKVITGVLLGTTIAGEVKREQERLTREYILTVPIKADSKRSSKKQYFGWPRWMKP